MVASVPVAVLTRGAVAVMFAGRLKDIAAGVIAAAERCRAGRGPVRGSRRRARTSRRVARAGRSTPPPVARPAAFVEGIVVDEQGKPVAGARVRVVVGHGAKAVTTKADGTFTLPTNEPRLGQRGDHRDRRRRARQGIFRFDGPAGSEGRAPCPGSCSGPPAM